MSSKKQKNKKNSTAHKKNQSANQVKETLKLEEQLDPIEELTEEKEEELELLSTEEKLSTSEEKKEDFSKTLKIKTTSRVSKNSDLYLEDFSVTKQQQFDFGDLDNTLDMSFVEKKPKKNKKTSKESSNNIYQKNQENENKRKTKSCQRRTIWLVILILILCCFIAYHFITFNHNEVKIVTKIKEKEVVEENIVFLGDSITELYDVDKYYSDYHVVNSGIGGHTTEDILKDMKNRVYQYNPSKVFLLIGTNDLQREKSVEEIVDNIKEILSEIRKNRSKAIIYLESIYPVNNTDIDKVDHDMVGKRNNDNIKEINKQLEEYCKEEKITYINLYKELQDNDGNLKEEYTKDGLHLSDEGYEKITEVLKKYIDE